MQWVTYVMINHLIVLVVCKAWKTLETEETRQKCLDIIEEATGRTDHMIAEKRRKLKKDGKGDQVEEDQPVSY